MEAPPVIEEPEAAPLVDDGCWTEGASAPSIEDPAPHWIAKDWVEDDAIDWSGFSRFGGKVMEDPPDDAGAPACLRSVDYEAHRVFFAWWSGKSCRVLGVGVKDGWVEVVMDLEKHCGGVKPEETIKGPIVVLLPASEAPVRPMFSGGCPQLVP